MTVQISPVGRQQFFTNQGLVANGYKLFTYAGGTTTKLSTYTSSTGGTANDNPIVLNSAGRTPSGLWLTENVLYKFVLAPANDTDPPTSPIWTEDNISAGIDASDLPFLQSGTGAVTRTAQEKMRERITFEDFGAAGDGAADDAPEIQLALTAGVGKTVYGSPGKTYLLNTAVNLPADITVDLRGSTLKPNGNIRCLTSTTPTAHASTTVASGASIGSRSMVVTSGTGIAAGQWYRMIGDNTGAGEPVISYFAMGRVKDVSGTTVTLDTPLTSTFAGTITFVTFTPNPKCIIRNGRIDGSASTYTTTTGQGLRIDGYERVLVENIELFSFDDNNPNTVPVQIYQCADVDVKLRSVNGVMNAQAIDIQECRSGIFHESVLDGSHFMINMVRVQTAKVVNNIVTGRRKQEADDSVSPVRSVRGYKFYGCASVICTNNHCYDVESGVKLENCDNYLIGFNEFINTGLSTYSGQLNINLGSSGTFTRQGMGRIIGNLVQSCGGSGIALLEQAGGPGKTIIALNTLRGLYAHGIYTNVTVPNVTVAMNDIENWGTEGSATYAAIKLEHASSEHLVFGNTFSNTDTDPPCLAITSANALIRDNVCSTANILKDESERQTDITITAGQLLALNATPKTLLAAPGAGFANVLVSAALYMDYNSVAYAGIGGTEDLAIRYTDGSGAVAATVETTGFLDQTADQIRYVEPTTAAALVPVANAALVLHMTTGEITTGDSPLKLRIKYRRIETAF